MKLPRRRLSASGRSCYRAAGGIAHRAGASLSVAAGASDRRLYPGWSHRHFKAIVKIVAVDVINAGSGPAPIVRPVDDLTEVHLLRISLR
jgi:hypothetical protein